MGDAFTPLSVVGSAPTYTNFQPRGYKKFQVWCSNNKITGVKLDYNPDPNDNGGNAFVGQTTGDSQVIYLDPGILLTSMTLWAGSDNQSVVGLSVSTNDEKRSINIGNTTSGQAVVYWIGSGFLVSVQGASGGGILTGLGFQFFKPIASVTMTIDDSDWWGGIVPAYASSLKLQTLSQATFTNQTNTASNYSFQDSVTRTDSRTIENSLSKTVGASVTVKASILEIVDVSATASWSMTTGQTVSNTTSTERALQWSLEGILPAMTTLTCRATCWQGIADVYFNCTINIGCMDNSSFSYRSGGISKNVLYSVVTADVVSSTPYKPPTSILLQLEPAKAEPSTQGKEANIEHDNVGHDTLLVNGGDRGESK